MDMEIHMKNQAIQTITRKDIDQELSKCQFLFQSQRL